MRRGDSPLFAATSSVALQEIRAPRVLLQLLGRGRGPARVSVQVLSGGVWLLPPVDDFSRRDDGASGWNGRGRGGGREDDSSYVLQRWTFATNVVLSGCGCCLCFRATYNLIESA